MRKLHAFFMLSVGIVLAIFFPATKTSAQGFSITTVPKWDTSVAMPPVCGLDDAFLLSLLDTPTHHVPPPSTVTGFAPNAIDTCGKFSMYFEDINSNTYIGFADTTLVGGIPLGQIRRTTYCQVLTYIQGIFDFSLVSNTDLIKIYVDTSYASAAGYYAPAGTTFYARCGPIYTNPANRYTGGFLNDYVRTGNDSASTYHAEMKVNFDSYSFGSSTSISYQEDTTGPYGGCNIDLFSVLLHESTHGMGWVSLVTFPRTDGILNNITPVPLLTNTFSKLDSTIFVGAVFPDTSLQKLIVGTPGISLSINPSAGVNCNNNYWTNNLPAPQNYPIFSGDYIPESGGDTFLIKSYISHMEDNQAAYSFRSHVSPGDRDEYVMGPFGFQGVKHRQYTKGELQILRNVLGYNYIGPDAATIFGNHPPFSRKMSGYDLWDSYLVFPDTVSADFTIANNGTSLTINLAALVASGDLYDADGDVISVDTGTVSNFRGCGSEGGNDHQLLSFSAGNTVIHYTPRPDFYGRAQFGFNLYDGKEDGSFYVITIDVKQGIFPTYAVGSNMVVNPGFENGTEMKVTSDQTKANTVVNEMGFHEGHWMGGSFSDGHPFNLVATNVIPYGSGLSVYNSFLSCYSSLSNQEEGAAGTSNPSISLPLTSSGSGSRYQSFSGIGTFSYYYLAGHARNCHHYHLSFDAYSQEGSATEPIVIAFKDDTSNLLSGYFDYTFHDTLSGLSATSWTHISVPFWYCGSDSSKTMLIGDGGDNFSIDNLSLTEDTVAQPPLLVSISPASLTGCLTQLTATVTNAACDTTYAWNATAGTTLYAAEDTVTTNDSFTYTVTVNDGCRVASDSFRVTEIIPTPITGPSTVCTGSTISLVDTTGVGGWTSSDTATAKIDTNTGMVTGISPGTVTITYAICRDFTTYTVTVYPTPSAITGTTAMCAGATATLSDAIGGGVWSSGTTTVATVGTGSGLVTGVSAGTAAISYTTGPGVWRPRE